MKLEQLSVSDTKYSFRVLLAEDILNFAVEISHRVKITLFEHTVNSADLVKFWLNVLPKLHYIKVLEHLI